MNSDLMKQALEKVGNPHILVNIVSRRVRQLNAGFGGISRPLILDPGNLGMADIALREIIEEKLGWEVPELEEVKRPVKRKVNGFRSGVKAPRITSPQVSNAIAT